MESRKRSELEEFQDWLENNKYALQYLSTEEIVRTAILVGFDIALVRQWDIKKRFQNAL